MKLVIDGSAESIDRALKELAEYKRKLKDKQTEIVKRCALLGKEIAQRVYGGSVAVSVVPTNGGMKVRANGKSVCFLEFGTGVYADASRITAENVPVEVYPGSWSETEGAHTWSRWIESGKSEMTYPYNRERKPGLQTASTMIVFEIERIAKEVFSND